MVIGFRYTIPHYELMAVYIWWQDPCKGLVNWLCDCLHHSRSPLNKKFYDIMQQLRQVKRTWKCIVFDQRLFNCYRVSFILKFWKFESKKFRILIEFVLLLIVITQKVSCIIMQPIFNRYHADNALCKHYNSCLDNLTIWYWNLKHNATMLWLSVKWNLEIA